MQHSDRLARGDGRNAKHLVEYALWAIKAGVKIRSVQDSQAFGDLLYAVVTGQRNHQDSARKSKAVKDGKRRQAERGEHLGGRPPDGYRRDGSGRIVVDRERAAVVRRIFGLAADGVPDTAIARSLNASGTTTKRGNFWSRRAIQALLTRPFYAGRIAYGGDMFAGSHPRLIEPADWDRLLAARRDRDLGRGRHTVGRPAKLHALQRLAICALCGRRMVSWTSAYRRKDGGRQRTYRCPGYHEANDSCQGTQVDAPTVDGAVLAELGNLIPDFDQWIAQITERQSGERDRLAALVAAASAERDEQARRPAAVEAKWTDYVAAGDDATAALVLPMLQRERRALADAEKRVQATQDALAATPAEAPADALLDFAASLQRALKGIDTTGSMGQVADALAEAFDGFLIWNDGDGCIAIEPDLHRSVVAALLEAGRSVPPRLLGGGRIRGARAAGARACRANRGAVQVRGLAARPGGRWTAADALAERASRKSEYAQEEMHPAPAVESLRDRGARFRNEIIVGVGGKQILLEDPSGNPIEMFEPTLPEAKLSSAP